MPPKHQIYQTREYLDIRHVQKDAQEMILVERVSEYDVIRVISVRPCCAFLSLLI